MSSNQLSVEIAQERKDSLRGLRSSSAWLARMATTIGVKNCRHSFFQSGPAGRRVVATGGASPRAQPAEKTKVAASPRRDEGF